MPQSWTKVTKALLFMPNMKYLANYVSEQLENPMSAILAFKLSLDAPKSSCVTGPLI
jgi:hypothetical protein